MECRKLADQKKCSGCSVCVQVCPTKALVMQRNERGFSYPKLNSELCIDCHKCEKVCPVMNKNNKISHNIKIVEGYFEDEKMHKESASGGAATALAIECLKNKFSVFATKYSDDFKTGLYFEIRNEAEISKMKGSRYTEIDRKNIYNEVVKKLKNGQKVLFIGLPCDVAAVKKITNEHQQLYTCELICHGVSSQMVHEKFVEEIERKYKGKIIYFNSRHKEENQKLSYLKVMLDNGREYKKTFIETPYGNSAQLYLRPSCYNCSFKGENRVADITIGDSHYWGKKMDRFNGISVLHINTEKGKELLDGLKEFKLSDIPYEEIKECNVALYKSAEKVKSYDSFFKYLKNKKLHMAWFCARDAKSKIKTLIKIILRKI